MTFVPVKIALGASGSESTAYDRSIELTARQLSAFEHEAGDLTEPLTAIGGDLRTQISAAFATEGATGATGKWTPLSPAYANWKTQHGPGLPILVGLRPTGPVGHRPSPRNTSQTYATSGRMMRSLLMPLRDPATWRITPNRLLYAPDSDIAGFHELGTSKMPARPPVDVSLTFLHSVDRTFVRWLAAVMRRTGL